MTDLRQAAQQALEALEGWEHCDKWVWPVSALEQSKRNTTESLAALRTALEQQAEPSQWRDMVVVSLVREGIDKHKARELADHFAAQQQAEPVSMRMPKVGDKVICLEDESLGEVVSLTGGGSPDITFDDGTRGTYLLREFAELFGYVAAPQQDEPPQRQWVGLTDEEIEAVVEQVANGKLVGTVQEFRIRFSRAIEAKLKERNI